MSVQSAVARQAALDGAKLQALVIAGWGAAGRQPASFGPGAALVASAAGATEAWLYLARSAGRGVGAALIWADRHEVRRLHVLVEGSSADDAGRLAREAAYFAEPAVTVWAVAGSEVAAAAPGPFPPQPAPQPAPALVDALIGAGIDIVTEGGIMRGEVNGLEVARIVHGETTSGVTLDGPILEIGVGAADRELTTMLYGELSPVDQLERAIEVVRVHRRAGAPHHPLNQLVPERWLRATLCRSPGSIGLGSLRPAPGARPRLNLRDRGIAVAAGETTERRPVVVACSVGIDVDLVPAAADARAFLDPEAELWLVVPQRDDHPTTRRLVCRLRSPARVVPVRDDWRSES